MCDLGPGSDNPGIVPRLQLNSGSNKITPRGLNANKIGPASDRSLAAVRSEESHAAYPKSSLCTGRRASPRAAPLRSSPRQDQLRVGVHMASLAEIKTELLGPEMRQLIREELRCVLEERHVADRSGLGGRRAADSSSTGQCAAQTRPEPAAAAEIGRSEPLNHLFHEGAEGMLGLHNSEDEDESAEDLSRARRSGHLTLRTARPSNLYKNMLSMLEVSVHDLNGWDRIMLLVQQRLELFGKQKAPPRTDPLSRLADSCAFDVLVHVVIILNVACMAFQADYDVKSREYMHDDFFRVMEIVFLLFYSFEFVVKFARSRWTYFYGVGYGWNWVDFIVLVCSIPFALRIDGSMDALPGKIIRMLRLARAVRVLQLVSFFKALNALLNSLAASVSTLICSLGMLVVFLFMFSLFFVMRIGLVLKEVGPELTVEQKAELLDSFGSIAVSMLTLLKVCTGGTDWSEVLTLLKVAGWETQTVFVAYISFSQMALLNIVLGLFVEQAMKSMASDKVEQAHRHFNEQSEFRATIKDLFCMAGIDTSEKITLADWRKCRQKHRIYNFLDFHGFQPSEVDQYLDLLANVSEEGAVDLNHFVNGCIRMKGGASSFSVYEVLLAVSELDEKMEALLEKVQKESVMIRQLSIGTPGVKRSSPKAGQNSDRPC